MTSNQGDNELMKSKKNKNDHRRYAKASVRETHTHKWHIRDKIIPHARYVCMPYAMTTALHEAYRTYHQVD